MLSFRPSVFPVFLALAALGGTWTTAEASNINLDLGYVDMSSAAYQRFKNYVDEAVAGDPDYGFSATDAAYMFRLTGQAQYCTLAVQMGEDQVSEAESDISGGSAPHIANDSYLYAGDMLMDLSLAYDWCSDYTTSSQRTRWAAYANQAVYNIWNPNDASWGGNAFHWSGWAVNDPGNNYHYSFIQATMYWGLAIGGQWESFLASVKLPALESYFATLPGGGSEEGTGYGNSHRRLFGTYRLWREATGTDLGNANSHMTDTIAYWVHATVPTMDHFVPIGDQARNSDPILYDYYRHLVLEARMETTDQSAKDLASWWLHSISVDHMANSFNYRHDLLPAGDGGSPPDSLWYHAPGVGVLFARTSWTQDATWLSFIAGPYTESHAHQEQGAFTLFGGGDWMTVTENIWTRSGIQQGTEVSNVVRFEHDGDIIPQDSPSVSDMVVTEGNDGTVHASADLTVAYGGNSNIGSWQRSLDFTAGGQLTVTDNYTVSSGTQAIFQLNLPNRPTVSGNTAIADGMQITVVQPADAQLRVVDWTDEGDDFISGYRLDITGSGNQFVVQLGRTDTIFDGGFDAAD
jgi:hypothetical protein